MASGRSNTPNSMIVLSTGSEEQNRPSSGTNKKYIRKQESGGKLEIFQGEEEGKKDEASGWSERKDSAGRVPSGRRSDSAGFRRSQTPTKQIALQAVKRKENDESRFEHSDFELQDPSLSRKSKSMEPQLDQLSAATKDLSVSNGPSHSGGAHSKPSQAKPSGDHEDEDTDSSSEDEEEEESKKAPNQLLMEFVTCLMEKDYPNAQKLCKMILIYEPSNAEALKFKPLIEEKMQLEAELALEGSDSEGDSDDDEEEAEHSGHADDADSGSDDSDQSSDSEDNEEEDEDEENLSVYQYMLKNLTKNK